MNKNLLYCIELFLCVLVLQGCRAQIPVGTYKGAFPVFFTGTALDGKTGQPLKEFNVNITLFGSNAISKTVQTTENEYTLSFEAPTMTGRTYLRRLDWQGFHTFNVLGTPDESIKMAFWAPGYLTKEIDIAKDRVTIDQINVLDIVLQPSE